MLDIFTNLGLQREDILARIAQSLQLDSTRRKRMESAYEALSTIIKEDDGFFKNLDIEIYAQGSVPIGATVKPWLGDEFDLDIVLHIKKPYTDFTPEQIYNALLNKLLNDGRYKHMVNKKRRCIRLKYAGDFHMDILPGCIVIISDNNNIKVPDRELKNWSDSNPKGYIQWFLSIANTGKATSLESYYEDLLRLKASIEDLPEDDFYKKTPLQRSVQLIKRYRDIFFDKNPEYATSSIILTTIAALFYKGQNAIFEAVDGILKSIIAESDRLKISASRIKILNPVNKNEDFTEKWEGNSKYYESFIDFAKDFYGKWQKLKSNFSESASAFEELFGDDYYKAAIKNQLKNLSNTTPNSLISKSSVIAAGNAWTDSKGSINSGKGVKNDGHRDYGE